MHHYSIACCWQQQLCSDFKLPTHTVCFQAQHYIGIAAALQGAYAPQQPHRKSHGNARRQASVAMSGLISTAMSASLSPAQSGAWHRPPASIETAHACTTAGPLLAIAPQTRMRATMPAAARCKGLAWPGPRPAAAACTATARLPAGFAL